MTRLDLPSQPEPSTSALTELRASYDRRHLFRDIMVFLIVAGLLSWHLVKLAMSRFDFFDMSAYMDAGYRITQGQRIYSDFFYMAGPVHPYLHALFFKLLGFNKIAVLTHLLTMHTIVLAAVFSLARRGMGLLFSIAILPVVSLTFFCTLAHPWYDINACVFIVLAVLVFELNRPFAGRLRAWFAPAACGVLIAMSFLCKSNVGLLGGVVIGAAMLVSAIRTRNWLIVVVYVAGGLIGLGAVLATLHSVGDFLQANLAYPAAGRLTDTTKLLGVIFYRPFFLLLVFSIVILLLASTHFLREFAEEIVLWTGLWITAVFAAWTGSMLWSANILLLGIVLLYLCLIANALPRGESGSAHRRISVTAKTIAWALLVFFIFVGIDSQVQTWKWRPSNASADYALTTESFAGWKCNHEIGEGVDASTEFIMQNVPGGDSLMIMPDAQIIYGLTGRVAPIGTPFIFWEGDSPPPGKLRDQFKMRFEQDPPQWLLVHEQFEAKKCRIDLILKWTGLEQFVNTRYAEVWRYGDFSLRRLQPRSAPTTRPSTG